MESKKNLLAILAALSCAPVSYASENNKKNFEIQKEITISIPNNNTKSDSKTIKSSLSIGKAIAFTILGTGAGVGGTLLTQHLMNRSKITDEVKSYLWTCMQLTYGYKKSRDLNEAFDVRPDQYSASKIIDTFCYSPDRFENTNHETLFNSLLQLYKKILESKEFISLGIEEDPEIDIVRSIRKNILGIPESYKDNNTKKYKWKAPENDKVYLGMPSNSEIKTKGEINSGLINYVAYTATFACDSESNITLKDFSIERKSEG